MQSEKIKDLHYENNHFQCSKSESNTKLKILRVLHKANEYILSVLEK